VNLSAPFIARPVATTLLTFGVLLAGQGKRDFCPAEIGHLCRPRRWPSHMICGTRSRTRPRK